MKTETTKTRKPRAPKTAAAPETAPVTETLQPEAPKPHAIFNTDRTHADASTRVKERQARAVSAAQKETKQNNTLVTATIYRNQRITATAIIEIALSTACRHVARVSTAQIADFVATELNRDSLKYKHEANTATRVRAHVRDAMNKLCILDRNDVIHFTQKFRAICNDPAHIARIDALILEVKKS